MGPLLTQDLSLTSRLICDRLFESLLVVSVSSSLMSMHPLRVMQTLSPVKLQIGSTLLLDDLSAAKGICKTV